MLITGAGPIGIMAAAVARHAGARYTVITDINPYRLELAKKLGVTLAVNVREQKLPDVQKQLGMSEGFDVGMEMSGSPAAFRDMLANMSHGARIAMLGIPTGDMSIDWRTVIFNMLTIKGIYGREMYETWYKMAVLVQSGLDISPVITHRFGYEQYEEAFATAHSGRAGKVIMPLPIPFILGCDLAGVVEAVGPEARRFKPGDRVWCSNQGLLGRQGTFAEYAAVDDEWLYSIPDDVSDEQATGVSLVGPATGRTR